MRENRVDLPYLILHSGFGIVALLKEMLKIIRTIPIEFCIGVRTISVNPT